jgi:hypothetical protein
VSILRFKIPIDAAIANLFAHFEGVELHAIPHYEIDVELDEAVDEDDFKVAFAEAAGAVFVEAEPVGNPEVV